MSAFNVPRPHIAAIVRAAMRAGQLPNLPEWKAEHGASALACAWCDKLAAANANSVAYRYSEAPEAHMLVPFLVRDLVDARVLSASELVDAIDCLDYQSCERPDWEQSDAWLFLTTLKGWAMSRRPAVPADRVRRSNCWPIYSNQGEPQGADVARGLA